MHSSRVHLSSEAAAAAAASVRVTALDSTLPAHPNEERRNGKTLARLFVERIEGE